MFFLVWLVQFLKKYSINLNFHDYSSTSSFKFSPIWVSKKRNNKESMICLTPKPSQKNVRNNWIFFMAFYQAQTLNPLDYTIWSIWESKTIATSHPNIGSLKTTIGEEWNKMSEKFILKTSKSFHRHVERIIFKKIAAILRKFTVLCLLSYFIVYFFNLKLILFYNRVIYYYTKFLIFFHILYSKPHKDGVLTDTTVLSQGEPGRNGKKKANSILPNV